MAFQLALSNSYGIKIQDTRRFLISFPTFNTFDSGIFDLDVHLTVKVRIGTAKPKSIEKSPDNEQNNVAVFELNWETNRSSVITNRPEYYDR